jgi:hypothetical protein
MAISQPRSCRVRSARCVTASVRLAAAASSGTPIDRAWCADMSGHAESARRHVHGSAGGDVVLPLSERVEHGGSLLRVDDGGSFAMSFGADLFGVKIARRLKNQDLGAGTRIGQKSVTL